MIVAVIASFIMPSAYHLALIYVSAATMFFLVIIYFLIKLNTIH
jgi:hypothetical protein